MLDDAITDEPFEVGASKGFYGFFLAACLLLVVACAGLVLDPTQPYHTFWGSFGLAAFGSGSLNALRRLLDRRPLLRVTSEGIVNRTSPLSPKQLIPWEQVLEVKRRGVLGIFEVAVRDPHVVFSGDPVLKRFLVRLLAKLYRMEAVVISHVGLDRTPKEIGLILDSRLDAVELASVREQALLEAPETGTA
jgi:hypothetical protein